MATEITVLVEDRPGSLAQVGEVLGRAGVNIEAILVATCDGIGVVRFVPDKPEGAIRALEQAGIPSSRREVLVVNVLNEPGALGDVALVMASAGINIDSVYATAHGRVVLAVDDLAGAMQVAHGMAVMG